MRNIFAVCSILFRGLKYDLEMLGFHCLDRMANVERTAANLSNIISAL